MNRCCDCPQGANLCSCLLRTKIVFFLNRKRMGKTSLLTRQDWQPLQERFMPLGSSTQYSQRASLSSTNGSATWSMIELLLYYCYTVVNMWTSRTNGVVRFNVVRAPQRAKLGTVYENRPQMNRATGPCPSWKRITH